MGRVTHLAGKIVRRVLGTDRYKILMVAIQSKIGIFQDMEFGVPSAAYQLKKVFKKSKKWQTNTKSVSKPNKVVMIHPRSPYPGLVQCILASRLILEGYQPNFLLCWDLPACNQRNVIYPGDENICVGCINGIRSVIETFGYPFVKLDDLISNEVRESARAIVEKLNIDEIDDFQYQDMPIGDYIRVSVSSYYYRGTPEKSPSALKVLKDFLYGSIVLYHAYDKYYADLTKNDLVIICNGRFFWYRIAYEMAVQRGLKVITYDDFGSIGGTGKLWMFSGSRPIAFLDLSESWENWKHIPLTKPEEKYLNNTFVNYNKTNPMYYQDIEENWDVICSYLNLSTNVEFDTIYTNLMWDSTAIDQDVAYSGMIDWVFKTVELYISNGKTLLIRVHPVEDPNKMGYPVEQKVYDELIQRYPNLPLNIKIIPFESSISSYTLLEKSRLNIVYTSTLGLEGALRGIPMVVAGKAPYRGKGFTIDVESLEHYTSLINGDSKPTNLTKEQNELAQRYAFLYLYRAHIPFNLFHAERFQIKKLSFSSLDEFLPGNDTLFDWLVDNILNSGDFAMQRELTNQYLGIE